MSKEDFVTFGQAFRLKELGFDWECNHWYHYLEPDKIIECQTYCNHNSFERPYSAPTLYQTQKWLREKGLIINIHYDPVYYYGDIYNEGKSDFEYFITENFETYESVLSVMIDKALEILKEENK